MRKALPLLVLLVLPACDDGAEPFDGPVQMVVDPATNYQETVVVEDSLDSSVDAVLWRGKSPSGLSVIRFVTPAYAQTAVDGAPVVGALVNSVGIGERPLQAWNPAAETSADGKARFWYEPGHIAGESCAEVRYADENSRMVTDTACAIVEPGPPVWSDGETTGAAHDPEKPTAVALFPYLTDQYGNFTLDYRVEAEGWLEEQGTEPGSIEALTVLMTDSVAFGDTTTVRFYDASGNLIVDGVGEKTNASARGVPTWAIRVIARAEWTPDLW